MDYLLYSTESLDTALALIGESQMADNAPGLYRQILKAVCGGDTDVVKSFIGADLLGDTSVPLLQQIFTAHGQ